MKKTDQNAAWTWILIPLMTLLVYLPAIEGGFVWDDDDYVTDNTALKGLDGLRRIWIEPGATPQYYPLVFSSFWLEYHAWGLHPSGYHLVNVLLHAANAVLLGLVLSRLAVPGAWVAAVIFAVHPVQVESVAWITERKNVLSGFFYLLSALAYLRCDGAREKKFYALSILLFGFALLSKSVTCTLPAALLLLAWWKRPRLEWRRDIVPLLPMFTLGAAMGVVTVWMERTRVGAQGGDWSLSLAERVLVAGRAIWFYAFKLFWPEELAFNYARWRIDPAAAWQYLFPIGALAILYLLWTRRGKTGRGPLVGTLFFALTLFPALGFISYYPMIYSYVADHFQYLAGIGLIALIACAIQDSRFKIQYVGPAVVLVLAFLTWRQAHVYRDLKTLWTDTLRKNPDSWLAHNNLGSLLAGEGRLGPATYHFERALRLNPGYDNIHYNMGVIFAQEGKSDEAIAHYREAIRLNPGSAQAHNNLGKALTERGDLESGIRHFHAALAIKPDYAKAHNNLGLALARKGEFDAASSHYKKAIRVDPEFLDPCNNLGVLQARQGRLADAQASFERAIQIRPDSAQAHANLARTLSQRGDFAEAKVHYKEALRIQPDLEEARAGLLQAEQRLQP